MVPSQLSTDVLLKEMHRLCDLGNEYFVSEKFWETKHTIKLTDDLLLILIVCKDTCCFLIQKNFPDTISVSYIHDERLFNEKVFHQRKVVVTKGQGCCIYLLNSHVCQFEHAYLNPTVREYLPLNIPSLVKDEFLLNYFSENSVSTPLQDQQ